MSNDIFSTIKKWAKVINEQPNYSCTHFYLSEDEKAMIIDLHRMKDIPSFISQLEGKEKAFLFIDLEDPKTCRYYACNIAPETFAYTDEIMGKLMVNAVGGHILKYIEENISELTVNKTPRSRLSELDKSEYEKNLLPISTSSSLMRPAATTYQTPFGTHMGGTPAQHEAWRSNYSPEYKEREKFVDTLYAFVKIGRTATAIDHIREFIDKHKESNKDMINIALRIIMCDKLDLVSTKELLIMTGPMKDELNERGPILTKFKIICARLKPNKANLLFKGVETDA